MIQKKRFKQKGTLAGRKTRRLDMCSCNEAYNTSNKEMQGPTGGVRRNGKGKGSVGGGRKRKRKRKTS